MCNIILDETIKNNHIPEGVWQLSLENNVFYKDGKHLILVRDNTMERKVVPPLHPLELFFRSIPRSCLEHIIQAALDEAYQNEVVETDMEHNLIGDGQEYADKKDWQSQKLDGWFNWENEI